MTVLTAGLSFPAAPLKAQDLLPRAPTTVPRVFFDCRGRECDNRYYRTEIAWVAWVRDQQDANVHVIMTSQNTGAGGREYQLDASYSRIRDQIFLPGGDLSDEERLLELQTQQTDSRASLNFGLSYQFGSIFNNGVNNRFPRGGGRGNF